MITIDPVITTYMVGFSAWELRRRMERGAARVLVSTSQVARDLEAVAEGVWPPPGRQR